VSRAAALIVFVGAAIARLAVAQPASDDMPFADVAARRSADGSQLVASAVGLPDERLPMVDARCSAARRAGERRARGMLHTYVDEALRTGAATPSVIAQAHQAVDAQARVTGVRGLVDCGAVVRMAMPFSGLVTAVSGAGVRFP